jgi:hypothetical protein
MPDLGHKADMRVGFDRARLLPNAATDRSASLNARRFALAERNSKRRDRARKTPAPNTAAKPRDLVEDDVAAEPGTGFSGGRSRRIAVPSVGTAAAYFILVRKYLADSSLSALPAVKRGCKVAGLALNVVGSPVNGLVPLRALVAAL